MNKIFVNNIGDLSEAQRASYYRFLSNGISEELFKLSKSFFSAKIRVTTKKKVSCLVYLYLKRPEIEGPEL